MNNRAEILDTYSVKSFHEMYNLSFLLMCEKIFSGVDVIMGKSAYQCMNNLCKSNQVVLTKKVRVKVNSVYEKDTTFGSLIRIFLGFWLILYSYFCLSKQTYLLFNSCNVLALPWLLLLNRLLKKNIVISLHGDIEYFVSNDKQFWKPWFWFALVYKFSFAYLVRRSGIRFIALSESIKQNVLRIYPRIETNLIGINHPYFFHEEYSLKQKMLNDDKRLVIGILGRLNSSRGLDDFLRIVKHFEADLKTGVLVLKSIGGRPFGLDVDTWKDVEWGDLRPMPREVFDAKVLSLDYILCLYPVESYRFTASGVAMDSLEYLKPIIGLKNHFLRAMPHSEDVGFLYDTVDEVIKRIEIELANGSDTSSIKDNLVKMRYCYSIGYNAHLLEMALTKGYDKSNE